jgi:hypothetical protein
VDKVVFRVQEGVLVLRELIKTPPDERGSAGAKGTPEFLLDPTIELYSSLFRRDAAQIFARENERDVRTNFLPRRLVIPGNERRPQNGMPAHEAIKTPFQDIRVERSAAV